MDVLAFVIAVLLILLLMRGRLPLSVRRPSSPRTYIRFYLRCIFSDWLLSGILGIIILHDAIPLTSIGLSLPIIWWPTLLAFLVAGLLSALLVAVHLDASKNELLEEKPRLAYPRTPSERLLWVVISADAGIWEELAFRGFLPWYIQHHLTLLGFSIPFVLIVLFSNILFGLGHLYQGRGGALIAGIFGIAQALLYATTGNLLASILWHFFWDVRFSIWPLASVGPVPAGKVAEEVQATPVPLLPLTPALPRPDRPQHAARKPKLDQLKRDQRAQPTQRVSYYARRLPLYPDLRAGRHQQWGALWKKRRR